MSHNKLNYFFLLLSLVNLALSSEIITSNSESSEMSVRSFGDNNAGDGVLVLFGIIEDLLANFKKLVLDLCEELCFSFGLPGELINLLATLLKPQGHYETEKAEIGATSERIYAAKPSLEIPPIKLLVRPQQHHQQGYQHQPQRYY